MRSSTLQELGQFVCSAIRGNGRAAARTGALGPACPVNLRSARRRSAQGWRSRRHFRPYPPRTGSGRAFPQERGDGDRVAPPLSAAVCGPSPPRHWAGESQPGGTLGRGLVPHGGCFPRAAQRVAQALLSVRQERHGRAVRYASVQGAAAPPCALRDGGRTGQLHSSRGSGVRGLEHKNKIAMKLLFVCLCLVFIWPWSSCLGDNPCAKRLRQGRGVQARK